MCSLLMGCIWFLWTGQVNTHIHTHKYTYMHICMHAFTCVAHIRVNTYTHKCFQKSQDYINNANSNPSPQILSCFFPFCICMPLSPQQEPWLQTMTISLICSVLYYFCFRIASLLQQQKGTYQRQLWIGLQVSSCPKTDGVQLNTVSMQVLLFSLLPYTKGSILSEFF